MRALDALEQLESVHLRHVEVGDEHVDLFLGQALERLFSVVCRDDDPVRLGGAQDAPQTRQHLGLVVHEQDARRSGQDHGAGRDGHVGAPSK